MPKRTDIHKILILGSGPIVLDESCEINYSGTAAWIRKEGPVTLNSGGRRFLDNEVASALICVHG